MAGHDQTYAEGADAPHALVPGAQLGRFTLRRILGEGGMGVVWAAHDPDLDREIAVKVLRTHTRASPALRKRLLREARAMARLKHPHVITVYEVGSSADTDFIAMELVEGETLDAWLLRDPTPDDVMRALLGAGRGLAAAHAAGLVHRDFKPHNVLRSRDGRVLVTDFGLARGLGEDGAAPDAATLQPHAALEETLGATPPDPLLDAPLTQTGAMIGTPAYMAPEQFHGAPPDPRTDQFAYCISAWQALTGARPFTGETLEALRDAALRGVGDVVANLAKPVRAVLARGLDPDPARRWPDMGTLLDALDAAAKPPRRAWAVIAPIAVLAAAAAIVILAKRDAGPKPIATCEPAAEVFAEAWSDTAARELGASEAAIARIDRAFVQFRERWTAKYHEACNSPRGRLADARLACLRGVRDEAVVVRYILRQSEARVLEELGLASVLPNLATCSSAAPVTPPEVPKDQPRRGRVLAVIARTMTLRWLPPAELAAAVAKLVGDATAAGWKPLVTTVQLAAARAHLGHGDATQARRLYREALPRADLRQQASAWLALLEASAHELEDPGDPRELDKLLTHARSAVRAAGVDPMLAGALSQVEADIVAKRGLWSRYRAPYKEALELAAEARKAYEQVDDVRRIAGMAHQEARMHLARGNERAVDDAMFVTRSAEEALARAGFDDTYALGELRAELALAKGDYREAHAYYDKLPRAQAARGPAISGRVVDARGTGVKATVASFRGVLQGDPMRAYTNPRDAVEIVETDLDGRFELHAGETVVAEAGALRSAPRSVQPEMTLVAVPTQSASGVVTGHRVPMIVPYAYAGDGVRYAVHGAIGRDGSYRLDGIPRGARLGIEGPAGHGIRRLQGKQVAWPTGPAIEVIVRARDLRPTATAYIFRGTVRPKTRHEADVLQARASDVAMTFFQPIGADATEAGRETYAAGDRHALVIGNTPGPVTVCVALDEEPPTPVACTAMTVEDDRGLESTRVLPVLFKTGQ